MHIRRIELTNFRNYEKIKLENLDNINIIIGNNGIGKTSILESIYVASTCRTFKSNDEGVLVNSNKDFFKVKVDIENNGKIKKLDYILTDNGKKTKINNILKRRISDYIFQYKVILFSPDEMKLIKESPNVRRNYLNVSLSQINKFYMKLLKDYNVLIKNKNEYLIIGNKKSNKSLSVRSVELILNNIIESTSLNKKASPHTLRHTFATHLLNDGCDILIVKELLGHSSLDTTGIYTHISNERLRKVYLNNHPRAKK